MGIWTTPIRWALIAAIATTGCTDESALEEAKQWYQPWFSEGMEAVDNALEAVTETEILEVAGGVVEDVGDALKPTLQENESLPYHNNDVGPDSRVVVIKIKRGETLGLYSKWSGIPSEELRALNEMKRGAFQAGKPFRLLLDDKGWRSFETARAEHFTAQENAFFTKNEVTELLRYKVEKNDSIWKIAKKHGGIPIWLLQKFNASYNMSKLKVGAELLIPTLVNLGDGKEDAAERLWADSNTEKPQATAVTTVQAPAPRGAPVSPDSIQSTGLDIKVVRNETVGHYRRWSGLSLQNIRNANPTLNPDRIQAGQAIHLPMSDARIAEFYQLRRQFHGPRTPKVAAVTPEKTIPTSPAPVAKPTPKPAPVPSTLQRHRVASGETAWAIAVKRYKISLTKLQKANPGKNLDRLHEGDVLNIPASRTQPGGASAKRAP